MIHSSVGFFFFILVSYVSVPGRITAEKSRGRQVCAKKCTVIHFRKAGTLAHIQVRRIRSKNRAVFERQDHKVNFKNSTLLNYTSTSPHNRSWWNYTVSSMCIEKSQSGQKEKKLSISDSQRHKLSKNSTLSLNVIKNRDTAFSFAKKVRVSFCLKLEIWPTLIKT